MLTIDVKKIEVFDEATDSFKNFGGQSLTLEHSLVSLAKWESKWHKPFLHTKKKTPEEMLDYIRCMTITPNVKSETYLALSEENLREINEYIEDPMTATTFKERRPGVKNREIQTAETIYYQMIAYAIPFECQKWHLNRLLTLIKVCSIKNDPKGNKMSRKEIYDSNRALNEARRKAMHSKG